MYSILRTQWILKICCHGTAVQSHIINILLQFLGLGNMGKYCPPSHAIIHISGSLIEVSNNRGPENRAGFHTGFFERGGKTRIAIEGPNLIDVPYEAFSRGKNVSYPFNYCHFVSVHAVLYFHNKNCLI